MQPSLWMLLFQTALTVPANSYRANFKSAEDHESDQVSRQLLQDPSARKQVRSGLLRWAKGGKCLNVVSGWLFGGNGGGIQAWDCMEGSADEVFSYTVGGVGPIRWVAHPEKCLNVRMGADQWGARIQIWDCAENDPAFQFAVPEEGKAEPIRWAGGSFDKCLNVDGTGKLQLHGCWEDMAFMPEVSSQSSEPPSESLGPTTPVDHSPTPKPTGPSPEALKPTPAHAEVYVMLGLTTVSNTGVLNVGDTAWKLDKLREANADGFMVDVWWGLTERQPKVYNFDAYKQLVQMAEQRGLKVQFVASFHQCGGNVGDDCSIPLPSWVTHHGDVWFKDQHGNQNKEYISIFADDVPLEGGRTPLDMYGDWMAALAAAFEGKLGNTITEIQVGMGPCGELRYPSYLMGNGWEFCGIGEFQAYDKHALANLSSLGQSMGWTTPPTDAGTYNSRPWDTGFFTGGYKSEYGKFFLGWYFDSLKNHGTKVLQRAGAAFQGKVALAGKVAGIHWWYGSESHAAEVTAGYYNTDQRDAYREIADVFAANGHASLDFTCLEMGNHEQPTECQSKPEDLVGQVQRAAKSGGVHFNGENALPRYDWAAYEKILSWKSSLFAFTYLRLTQQLVTDGFDTFKGFVHQMHQGS